MIVEVTLYRKADWTAIGTYKSQSIDWRSCVHEILSWLRIEVLPYWDRDALRIAPNSGTDVRAAAAIYGAGLVLALCDEGDHDWLRPGKQLEEGYTP